MHQQIRTSPGSTEENIKRVIEVLADAGINIEGIGPDFESPHVRVHVDHPPNDDGPWQDAFDALLAAGLQPVPRESVTVSMPNTPGAVRAATRHLTRRGFRIESVLVLATHEDEHVRVSFGVARKVEQGWEETSHELADELAGEMEA
jgi:hypothetical protein